MANMAFTPCNIASMQNISGVQLSPNGSKVVYRVSTAYKDGEHATAALWYSPDSTKADSAKQLTSGLFDDEDPVWHPSENTIYFLSDRHKQGGPKQIYKYSLDGPGEPSLVHELFKEKKRPIIQFKISPDGRYIAFCSPDEPSDEDEKKTTDKDDARVWGERKEHARLRLLVLSTGEVRTLVEGQKHVASCTWSPDSKELVYLLHSRPDLEAAAEPTTLFIVSIIPSSPTPTPRYVTTFHHSPAGVPIWPSPSHSDLFELQPYDSRNFSDALSVYRHSQVGSSSPLYSEQQRIYLGESEDAQGSLINLDSETGEFAVEVAEGMRTRIDILNRNGKLFKLFTTSRCEGVRFLDVKRVGDGYVLACVRSSGPNKQAPNVWVGRAQGTEMLTLETKLSSHYSWMDNSKLGDIEVFEWKGQDGVSLEGTAWFPQGVDPSSVKKPLPTILHVHGGPYSRDVPDLWPTFARWQAVLAEQGYLVLSPNYRGSSGRGHVFARAAYHGMGTIEWSDVNAMVDEAVKRGLADKDKLAIGGWSQGGFMTAWGVSQTKSKFRCGVMGAGVSDWGSIASESDLPDIETELGGAAPWYGSAAKLTGDAIRHVKDVETAVLILHGERDERVPIGQAVGFHRGLRRMSKYPERHTLVVYPREKHGFTECKHVEDVIKRVIAHYEVWLK